MRQIFDRYLALGSVRRLAEELEAQRIHAPRRRYSTGKAFGGGVFSRGQLYFILKNPTYAGDIVHKDKTYPGQHPAIIARDTFAQVQQMLAAHVQGRREVRAGSAPLAGKLIGPRGEPLTSAHSTRGKLRYRYYVSRDLHHDGNPAGLRIPAREIEETVFERISVLLADPLALLARLQVDIDPARLRRINQRTQELGVTLKGSRRGAAAGLVSQVRLGERDLEIDIDTAQLAQIVDVPLPPSAPPVLTLSEAARLTRTGKVFRLLDGDGCATAAQAPNKPLLKMIIHARAWWATLAKGEFNVQELAAAENMNPSRLTRVLRLAFLAPAVIEALLDGKAKANIGCVALVQPGAVPASWDTQAERYLAAAKRVGA